MKRGLEESYGLVKRARPIAAMPELRLLIPSKGAGAVIGKGGDNIRRLRNDMHADIAVPDSSTPERVVNITTTMGNIAEILTEIILKIEEVAPRVNDSELRVLVHQSQAGAIIGRGGTKIKELREATGTDITVLSECCPMSTDRVVIIKGESTKIINAVKAIMQICNDVPIKGMVRNYDATNYEPAFAEVYGGYPDRKVGRGRPGIGGPGAAGGGGFGGRPGLGRAPGGMRAPGFGRGGGGAGGGGYDDFDGGYGGYGGPGGPGGRYMDPSMGAFDDGGEVTVSQFTVPSDLAGTIIGKGGDRITRIREESGAKIVVNPPEGDSSERVITIKGTPGRIQAAKFLLQQCVKASPQGRRYIQLANS